MGTRVLLVLVAAATAVVMAVAVLGIGLPLAARRALAPDRLVALVLLAGATGTAVGALLLFRLVDRPLGRIIAAGARLDRTGPAGFPIIGEGAGEVGAATLSRAAVAFERALAALAEERTDLAAKVRELTETNRALEAARASLVRSERMATVGLLAAGLAHEVGNPLGAIAGYADLARGRIPAGADPELSDAVDRIASAAQRIDRTVRDLLDFARPAPPRLASLDLAGAVDAALRLAEVQPRFRGVEVRRELPPGLPPVFADAHQLGQVVLNLLLNAGDAMEGRGEVRIAARAEERRVALEVRDRGPGIPPADLQRIFDPFFTTKEASRGSGLGLAISQRILEALGGEITAANAEGGGALFTIWLRAAPGMRNGS